MAFVKKCPVGSISIHALVKRATVLIILFSNVPRDFNPRPREEGDVAPYRQVAIPPLISIHALVKRATFDGHNNVQHNTDFNPRPREEGDQFYNKL